LVDEGDPAAEAKLKGLNQVWDQLGERVSAAAANGLPLNKIKLEVVNYQEKNTPDSPRVEFDIMRRSK